MKKEQNNKIAQDGRSTFVIRSLKPKIEGLELTGIANLHKFKFLIDPGATRSIFLNKLCQKLDLNIQALNKKFQTQIASGELTEITSYIDLGLDLDKIPCTNFKTECYVLDGELDLILLGETFLIQQEVEIDYMMLT